MLACVKTDISKSEVVQLPEPEPGRGEIVIKTSMATICGSDMHFLDELANDVVGVTFPGAVLPEGLPMGHEGVGHVYAVGEDVTRVKEGDRVIASCLTPCGKCRECQHGDFGICTSRSPFGSPLFGCQAEYYLVPNADVCVAKVPESVSDEHALLATDIMSAGFAGIERADAGVGDSVAIFAQGPLGLCATAGARVMGCGLIIAVDSIPNRLEVAKRLGANVVINPKEKDPVAEITALTGGEGVDVAVEAVGAQATLEAASRVVRRGGTISSIGIYTQVPQVSMPTLIPSFHHRRLITTMCPSGRDRMEHLLALLQHGDLELEALFTHRMKLVDTPKAYDLFRSKADGVLKIAITM